MSLPTQARSKADVVDALERRSFEWSRHIQHPLGIFSLPGGHLRAENSGVDGGVVVDKMRTGTGNVGFDAAIRQVRGSCPKPASLIRDPTKVVRLALENAVSVAGVLLLTEATMTEVTRSRLTSTVRAPPGN